MGRIQELYGISTEETQKQLAEWEMHMQQVGRPNESTLTPPEK
jgi:hypothetical protein